MISLVDSKLQLYLKCAQARRCHLNAKRLKTLNTLRPSNQLSALLGMKTFRVTFKQLSLKLKKKLIKLKMMHISLTQKLKLKLKLPVYLPVPLQLPVPLLVRLSFLHKLEQELNKASVKMMKIFHIICKTSQSQSSLLKVTSPNKIKLQTTMMLSPIYRSLQIRAQN